MSTPRGTAEDSGRDGEWTHQADLLRTIFANMGEGITVFDADLRLIAWNQRSVELTGMDPATLRPGAALRDIIVTQAQAGEFGPCDPEVVADRYIREAWSWNGGPFTWERTRPDGRTIELRRQRTESGSFITIYVDITNRKKAEQALRDLNATLERRVQARTAALAESEGFNRATLDAIQAQLAVLDGGGRIIATNAAWQRPDSATALTGQSIANGADYLEACERATGSGVAEAGAFADGIRTVIAGERDSFTVEYGSPGPDGLRRFLCRVSRFGCDGATRVVVAHDDISALHEAQALAAARERTFASLALASPIGIFRCDLSGGIEYVNPRWSEITGRSEHDARGQGWMRWVHPDDFDRVTAGCDATGKAGAAFSDEFRWRRPDDSVAWATVQAALIRDVSGNPAGYVGTLTDITERKAVELAMQALSGDLIELEGSAYLEAAARRLATLLDADVVTVTRAEPARPSEIQTIVRIEDGALLPNIIYPAAGTPSAQVADGRFCLIGHGAQAKFPVDPFLAARGIEAYAAAPLIDRAERPIGHLAVMSRRPFHDLATVETITKMFGVAVAAALRRARSRRQYEDLFAFAPEGLLMIDRHGRIVRANQRAEELFGWTADEMAGQPIEMLVPARFQEGHAHWRRDYQQSPQRRLMGARPSTLVGLRKDGSEFAAEIALAPVEFEDGPIIAAAVRDITERQATAAQLAQARKMEVLGRLTGGMAHDFNNYLGVIIGTLDMLAETVAGDPVAGQLVDAAMNGALRAAEQTRSLLAFSRRQPLTPQLIDVSRRLAAIVQLLSRTLGEDIELVGRLAVDTWMIRVDGSQLDSCVVNLANNARDAMPQGGAITIATRNVHVDDGNANADLLPGDYVLIEIADTGVGMPPEVLTHAFEPFFTTKPVEHGTGLGLSMAYGFVKQSDGHISLDSGKGRGTVVRIYLPRAHDVEDGAGDPPDPAVPSTGTETVLVVEDNEHMRQTATRQLASLGYRVIEAENGAAALAIVDAAEPPIDLLFTDVVMPGPTRGYDLARLAMRRRPGIKVLLTSGFSDRPTAAPQSAPALPMLQKPYRKLDLARAVREVLDANAPGVRDAP